MSNEQGRRAGRIARPWWVAVATFSVVCALDAQAQAQVTPCDAGPSWVSRSVADFAVRAAIQRAGLSGRSAASDVAARARATAWLPTVSARAGRGLNSSASSMAGLLPSERAAESEALSFEVRVVWALNHAFYSRVELEAERAEVQRSERRRAIEREVIDVLVQLEQARREATSCAATGTPQGAIAALRARALLESWTGLDADELRRRAMR
ncbi:MAG: hypothetical protein U0269_07090 [Polyangiales bacterium]